MLEYNRPFAVNPSPMLLFGQTVFTAAVCNGGAGATSITLCNPQQLLVDSADNLYVADTGNNRVLEYNNPLLIRTAAAGCGDNSGHCLPTDAMSRERSTQSLPSAG